MHYHCNYYHDIHIITISDINRMRYIKSKIIMFSFYNNEVSLRYMITTNEIPARENLLRSQN